MVKVDNGESLIKWAYIDNVAIEINNADLVVSDNMQVYARGPIAEFSSVTGGTLELKGDHLANNVFTKASSAGIALQSGSTATFKTEDDETTDIEIAPANSARVALIIVNNSTADMYIKYGTGASLTSRSWPPLETNGVLEITNYTGAVHAAWASDAGGDSYITEVIS